MAEPEAAPDDDRPSGSTLNERLLDALVYVPAGLALSVAEELPRLAARGRQRLGVRVSSARAVGQFAVKAGHDEFLRRSEGWFARSAPRPTGDVGPSRPPPPGPAGPPPSGGDAEAPSTQTSAAPAATDRPADLAPDPPTAASSPAEGAGRAGGSGNGHIPTVTTLSIPGFDALSASQVVQRLDGLNRSELVSVRAYEASTRGRRTILSRVDQLLDERS